MWDPYMFHGHQSIGDMFFLLWDGWLTCVMDERVILLWLSNQYPHISTGIIVLSSMKSLFFTACHPRQHADEHEDLLRRLMQEGPIGAQQWWRFYYDRDGHPWCFKLYPRYITYFMGFPFGTCSTNGGLSWIVYVEGSHLLSVLLQ